MTKVSRGRGPYRALVPWELQDDPDVDAATVATYAAVQRYADFGGSRGARVSHKRIAQKAGCSLATVKARLALLRSKGWVDWETGQNGGAPNEYTVHLSIGGVAASELPGGQETATRSPGDSEGGSRETTTTKSQDTDIRDPDGSRADREERLDKRDHAVARSNGETWITPYANLHEEILGGRMGIRRHLRTFRPLDQEHGAEKVLRHQRNYLEHLVDTGREEFLNYPKWAETFDRWANKPSQRQRRPRPTASTKGKDFAR